jgi:hypothetical protein
LCLTGFLASISLLAEAYSIWVITAGGPGSRSLGGVAGWTSSLLGGQLSLAALAVLFLVAPDGHLLSRRWRAAAIVTLVGLGSYTVGVLTLSPAEFDLETHEVGPIGSIAFFAGLPLIACGLIAAAVSMVRRLHRSHGWQRQQLRMMVAAVLFVAGGFVWLIVVQAINGGQQTWAASLPLFVGYACLPVLFAVAVLGYRMYDIELLINRAVVLAVGTAFAGIGYICLVVVVATLVNTRMSGFWLSLLATSLVAIAFQPLRRVVVRLANRLAYGSRALPYEALSEFSRRLAETPTPGTLLAAVAEAAGRSVSARRSTAVLRVLDSGSVAETWPADTPDKTADYEVLVQHGGETLGSIAVSMPKGRPLRVADKRLLDDLAAQTAVAFRNAATEAELAEHVAALGRTTQALAESRRRIIAADDAARRQLESALSRNVLPHLDPMPARLGSLSIAASAAAATDELEQLVTEATRALESLREVTRGVFPTQLGRAGLGAALRSHLARSGMAAALYVDPSADRRFPAKVEAAVYFCIAEAVRAGSGSARIDLVMAEQDLFVQVRGVAGEDVDVQAIVDRVEAVGGSLALDQADMMSIGIPIGAETPAAV